MVHLEMIEALSDIRGNLKPLANPMFLESKIHYHVIAMIAA